MDHTMGLADQVCSDAEKLAEEIWSDPMGDKREIAAAILRGFVARGKRDAKAVSFWDAQAEWSRKTFGADGERGPVGPLKHLAKETQEALEALQAGELSEAVNEIVDCQFLVFDAARRAGLTFDEFFVLCFAKLDEPIEHVRG